MTTTDLPASIDELQQRLLAHDYVADRQLATAVYLTGTERALIQSTWRPPAPTG